MKSALMLLNADLGSLPEARGIADLCRQYYANPQVRERMGEFLGGAGIRRGAAFILSRDAGTFCSRPLPPSEIWSCLERGEDVSRSLWDRSHLVIDLDVEYVNFDFPAEAYLNPERSFRVQRPVVECIRCFLENLGIRPLELFGGRGRHFLWTVRQDSEVFWRLARLGRVPTSQMWKYRAPHPPDGEVISAELAFAYSGLGLLMEYLAHRVRAAATEVSPVPVQLTEVEVGPGERGREIVSLDLSEYGDCLYSRHVRIPFSLYLKPFRRAASLGPQVVDAMRPMLIIPTDDLDEEEALAVSRSPAAAADLAGRVWTSIPDFSKEMDELVTLYAHSELARFHELFYSEDHDPPEVWSQTYDRTPLDDLPSCVRRTLQQPNELLLKPGLIQLVTRTLLARGWHPRHIAGLVRSRYERDFGWGDRWYVEDAAARADFYTRLFAGLVTVEEDRLIDFNCRSSQEKGQCLVPECRDNLADFRRVLVGKLSNE